LTFRNIVTCDQLQAFSLKKKTPLSCVQERFVGTQELPSQALVRRDALVRVKSHSYRVRYSVQFGQSGNLDAQMVERAFLSRAVLGAVWAVRSNWVI
jgi:hypothetical protein